MQLQVQLSSVHIWADQIKAVYTALLQLKGFNDENFTNKMIYNNLINFANL